MGSEQGLQRFLCFWSLLHSEGARRCKEATHVWPTHQSCCVDTQLLTAAAGSGFR
jgi:hypothetical protein